MQGCNSPALVSGNSWAGRNDASGPFHFRVMAESKNYSTMQILKGKCSQFGGPKDTGVGEVEGVALYTTQTFDPYDLFLPGEIGFARGLNPRKLYCAMRWDYNMINPVLLRHIMIGVRVAGTQVWVWCHPVDFGPGTRTGRLIDLSPGAMRMLAAQTDWDVEVCWEGGKAPMPVK